MDGQQPDDEMKTLYDDFVDALKRGADLSRFSKDDLLDIYDYSRGIPEDFVALEALLCGVGRYPRSRDFRKRLALYMHDLGQDDLAERAADRLPDSSVIRLCNTIGSLSQLPDDRARFETLFGGVQKGSLEDGDMLYIIDMLESGGLLRLVYDFDKELSELCQYPTTVYHELYRISIDAHDYETAHRYGVRLTEMEPFNIRFWVELANLQSNYLFDYEGALETIEYALAIDPDSADALLSKANVLFASDPAAARSMVESLLRRQPDDLSTIYFLAHMEFKDGNTEAALSLMRTYLSRTPDPDKDFFDTLFAYNQTPLADDFRDALTRFARQSTAIALREWCEGLYYNKVYGGVVEVVSTGKVYMADDAIALMACEAYYGIGLYRELIDFILANKGLAGNPLSLDLPYALIYAVVKVAMGDADGLRDYVDQIIASHDSVLLVRDTGVYSRLIGDGAMKGLLRLSKYLHGDESVSFADINPFVNAD